MQEEWTTDGECEATGDPTEPQPGENCGHGTSGALRFMFEFAAKTFTVIKFFVNFTINL